MPEGSKGVALTAIGPDSPAEKGGLEQGDVIISVEGAKVDKTTDLQQIIAETTPGDTVKIELYRNGKKLTKQVQVGLRSAEGYGSLESTDNQFGMKLVEVTPETKRSLNLRQNHGLVVYSIDETKIAYEIGLREGDILLEGNRKKLMSWLPQLVVAAMEINCLRHCD